MHLVGYSQLAQAGYTRACASKELAHTLMAHEQRGARTLDHNLHAPAAASGVLLCVCACVCVCVCVCVCLCASVCVCCSLAWSRFPIIHNSKLTPTRTRSCAVCKGALMVAWSGILDA